MLFGPCSASTGASVRQRGPTGERGFSSRRDVRFDLRSPNDERASRASKAAGSRFPRGSKPPFESRAPNEPLGLRDPKDERGLSRLTNDRGSPASAGRDPCGLVSRAPNAPLGLRDPNERGSAGAPDAASARFPAPGTDPLPVRRRSPAVRAAPRLWPPRFFMGIVSSRYARRSR